MKKQFIPLVIVLVVVMCIISEYTGEKEIIFPEIAALAIGAWTMKKSPWGNKSFHFWLSPTIAALTGLVITRFLPYAPFLMISGAFVLVTLQLSIIGSEVSPSLSAAILPILMHTQSWYYPLSVFILTGIIAGGKKLIDSYYDKNYTCEKYVEVSRKRKKFNPTKRELINSSKLLTSIIMVSAVALYFHLNYIIAPPLIVAFVEFTKVKEKIYLNTVRVFILLTCAAILGVIWLYFIYYLMNWPIWISSALSMICILLIFHFLKFSFPPAAAITLLPIIIPFNSLWMYPWEVLVGSTIFLLINLVWFKKVPINKFLFVNK